MFKNLLKAIGMAICFCAFLISSLAQAQTAYIKAGDAKVKKSILAFPFFNNTGSNNTGAATAAASEVYTTAKKNLDLSTYFQLVANDSYLEDPAKTGLKPVTEDKYGFKFEP
ncbi:MAG: hypothetical protein K2P92_06945, partial [Bdellovibrionaceae bacterium]|nr:hypothetical protein [Pseudobdellovibrionaceae bacterium]